MTRPTVAYAGHHPHTGYGVAARRAAQALAHHLQPAVVPVEWVPLVAGTGPLGRGWHPRGATAAAPRVDVLVGHTPPDHAGQYRRLLPHARFVAHTVWESDVLPDGWAALLNGADGDVHSVIVPTEWNRNVFLAGGVAAPIHVIAHCVPPAVAAAGTEHRHDGDALAATDALAAAWPELAAVGEATTVFVTIGAWDRRKDPALTVEAYLRAFGPHDATLLVVKTEPFVPGSARPDGTYRREDAAWWRCAEVVRRHTQPAPVLLITRDTDDAAIATLLRRADAVVSLTHGEGWGLSLFDAATIGRPVVTTGWGGALAYLGSDHPGLVDASLEPAHYSGGAPIGRWASPQLDHAVELLRTVARGGATHWDAALARAAQRCRSLGDPARVGAELAAACGL